MAKPSLNFVPLGLRPPEAAAFLGISEEILERCKTAGWVKPSVAMHRLVIYDTSDLRLLWNRIKAQGLPERPQRRGVETQAQHSGSQEGV